MRLLLVVPFLVHSKPGPEPDHDEPDRTGRRQHKPAADRTLRGSSGAGPPGPAGPHAPRTATTRHQSKKSLSAPFCFCGLSAPFCVRFCRIPYQITRDRNTPFCALSAGPRQIIHILLAAPCTDLSGCCYQSRAVALPLHFCDVTKPSGKSELLLHRIAHSDGETIRSANFQTKKSVERHNIIMYILDIY